MRGGLSSVMQLRQETYHRFTPRDEVLPDWNELPLSTSGSPPGSVVRVGLLAFFGTRLARRTISRTKTQSCALCRDQCICAMNMVGYSCQHNSILAQGLQW